MLESQLSGDGATPGQVSLDGILKAGLKQTNKPTEHKQSKIKTSKQMKH